MGGSTPSGWKWVDSPKPLLYVNQESSQEDTEDASVSSIRELKLNRHGPLWPR